MNISNDNNQPLITYLRSDETIGHINWLISFTIAAYVHFFLVRSLFLSSFSGGV